MAVLVCAIGVSSAVATDVEEELRPAVLEVVPHAVIRSVTTDRVVGDAKTRATVDLQPFESAANYRRLPTLHCVLYDGRWECLDPTHVIEIDVAGGVERVEVDEAIPTETALDIRQFVLSRPIVETGDRRRLADEEVRPVYSIKRVGRWKYFVIAGSRSMRSSKITIERRFMSWPVGRLAVVEFVEAVE